MKTLLIAALLVALIPTTGLSQEEFLTDTAREAAYSSALQRFQDLHEQIEDLSQELKIYDLQMQRIMIQKSQLDPDLAMKIKALQSDIEAKSRLAETLVKTYKSIFGELPPSSEPSKKPGFDEGILVDKALINLNSLKKTDLSEYKEFSFDTPPSASTDTDSTSETEKRTTPETSNPTDEYWPERNTQPEGMVYKGFDNDPETEAPPSSPPTPPTSATSYKIYRVKINDSTIAEFAIVVAPAKLTGTTLGELDLPCYSQMAMTTSSVRSISKEYPSPQAALPILEEKLSALKNETTTSGCTVTTATLQNKRVVLGKTVRQHMIAYKGATKSR
jgi:hypothetical protein